jgi:hypothetical protein
MVVWMLGVGLASARDAPNGPPAEGARPSSPPRALAIPAEAPDADPPQARLRPRVQLPDASRLAAMGAFRSKRLTVRRLADLEANRGDDIGPGGYVRTWGPWGPSWSWMWVPEPASAPSGAWGVVQGGELLDVPSTLAVLADPAGAPLERRIRSLRTVSTAVYTVGVAGLATSVLGIAGVDRAEAPIETLRWTAVTASGVGMLVGGFVGGTLPAARANRLQFDPSASLGLLEVEEAVDGYNARLLEDLDLMP